MTQGDEVIEVELPGMIRSNPVHLLLGHALADGGVARAGEAERPLKHPRFVVGCWCVSADPTRRPDGDAINGTLLVVEADGIGVVMVVIENDP